jgi:hypothetical protein
MQLITIKELYPNTKLHIMKKLLLNKITQNESETIGSILVQKSILKRSCIVLLILLISACMQAQDIRELNEYLEQAKKSTDHFDVEYANHIESLVNDLQPRVYISNTKIQSDEQQPVCAEIKADAIDQLYQMNPTFAQVEFITIMIYNPEELNFILDISKLIGFTNLKTILFVCEFNIETKDVQKLYSSKLGINVFYKVSIPS